MKNTINITNNITNKRQSFKKTINADEYIVVGKTGDKMEMMSNLDPEDLLIFLSPLLMELGERFNLFEEFPIYNN